MPKKHRLSHADLARLSRVKSRRVHGTYFSLTIASLSGRSEPKTVCVVSKKIATRAVDRNRIQRRYREIIRPRIARLHHPLALVFYAKRAVAAASFTDVKKDIEGLLARAALA